MPPKNDMKQRSQKPRSAPNYEAVDKAEKLTAYYEAGRAFTHCLHSKMLASIEIITQRPIEHPTDGPQEPPPRQSTGYRTRHHRSSDVTVWPPDWEHSHTEIKGSVIKVHRFDSWTIRQPGYDAALAQLRRQVALDPNEPFGPTWLKQRYRPGGTSAPTSRLSSIASSTGQSPGAGTVTAHTEGLPVSPGWGVATGQDRTPTRPAPTTTPSDPRHRSVTPAPGSAERECNRALAELTTERQATMIERISCFERDSHHARRPSNQHRPPRPARSVHSPPGGLPKPTQLTARQFDRTPQCSQGQRITPQTAIRHPPSAETTRPPVVTPTRAAPLPASVILPPAGQQSPPDRSPPQRRSSDVITGMGRHVTGILAGAVRVRASIFRSATVPQRGDYHHSPNYSCMPGHFHNDDPTPRAHRTGPLPSTRQHGLTVDREPEAQPPVSTASPPACTVSTRDLQAIVQGSSTGSPRMDVWMLAQRHQPLVSCMPTCQPRRYVNSRVDRRCHGAVTLR
ncbi:hypothetical protein KEM55_001948 [Ascosphaera atra]|nr:hypothetical protein KEM55_001948 [Ascosphaera atra]